MRRLAGGLLLVGGLALLGVVGWQYASGWLARDRIRAQWAQEEAERARLAANARADLTEAALVLTPGAPVVRLRIPRIGLDEIVVHGVGEAELNASPGHLPGTPLPGGVGNAVLSAHRDLHFRKLGQLRIGDTLTTETPLRTVRWRITGRRIVGGRTPALFQTPAPTLTLTTCWPMRAIGPAPDRLLLTAEPLDPLPAPPAPGRAAGHAVSAAAGAPPERRS